MWKCISLRFMSLIFLGRFNCIKRAKCTQDISKGLLIDSLNWYNWDCCPELLMNCICITTTELIFIRTKLHPHLNSYEPRNNILNHHFYFRLDYRNLFAWHQVLKHRRGSSVVFWEVWWICGCQVLLLHDGNNNSTSVDTGVHAETRNAS